MTILLLKGDGVELKLNFFFTRINIGEIRQKKIMRVDFQAQNNFHKIEKKKSQKFRRNC